jgi:hypothetical protein
MQAWFSGELNALKALPEGLLSPSSPTAAEPATASMSAVTPFLPPLPADPSAQLKLPLSREMALSVFCLIFYHMARRRSDILFPGVSRLLSGRTTSYQASFWTLCALTFVVGRFTIWMRR